MPLLTQLSQTAQQGGLHANQLIVGNNIKHIVSVVVLNACIAAVFHAAIDTVALHTIVPSRH
jgi:hypothetical protein